MKFCTHMAYIFVGSYAKFEVDGSVRYRVRVKPRLTKQRLKNSDRKTATHSQ